MLYSTHLSSFFDAFIEQTEKETNGFFQDLHIHTLASDGSISVEQIADFLLNKKYLISITDHNEISGNIALAALGIHVVPGIELGCQDGFEILVYFSSQEEMVDFYNKEVKGYKNPLRMARTTRSIFEYLDILKMYDCHLSIPHIAGFMQKNFIENKDYIYDIIPRVDALEIHNDTLNVSKNKKASTLQKKFQKCSTFGSDAHSLNDLKSFYHLCNKSSSPFSKISNPFWKAGSLIGIGRKHLLYFVINVL